MGGLTSSSSESKTTKDETTETRPLPEQMPYLTKAWSTADSLLDKSNANIYTGNFVAAPNANQYQSFGDAYKWATGQAQNQANSMYNTGANQLAGGTAGQSAAMSGLLGAANSDTTASNIAKANAYASQQNVGDIVKASMYDANRNAAESTIPNLYRQAAASGNINSDRTALAQGVVQRGLAEQAQNLSATTRASLFNQGLSMAQQQNAQQLQALAGAGSLGSTAASQGYTGSQAGFDNYGKSLTAQQAAAMGQQGLDQNVLDNDYKKWYSQYQQPWTNLQQYYGITGDLKGGTAHTTGTSTTESTQTPSMLSSIGQGIGLFGSLFCDERLKNVLSGPIGKMKGHNTYLFTYKFDPSEQIHCSVIAQEVEQTNPDAVFEVDGVKLVDLSKL